MENITAPKPNPREIVDTCMTIAKNEGFSQGLEQGTQAFSTILILIMISNLALVFLGRVAHREKPYKFLGVQLPKLLGKSKAEKLNRLTFSLQFTLVAFLTAVALTEYGFYTVQ
jgi:hypothetical protein